MLNVHPSSSRFMKTVFTMAMIAAFGITVRAQKAPGSPDGPYVDDWSHHHMVFSSPGTRDDAVRNGKDEDWRRINNDARFRLQRNKRQNSNRPVIADVDFGRREDHFRNGHRDHGKGKPSVSGLEKDWTEILGGGVSVIGTIGTLNSSSITGSSTLAMDGVTFTASAPTAATRNGTFTNLPTNNQTATITNGANALVLTAGTSNGTGTVTIAVRPSANDTITVGGTTYTWVAAAAAANQITRDTSGGNPQNTLNNNAQNLRAAIDGNVAECFTANCITGATTANASATATVSNAVVTVTDTTAGTIAFSTSNTGSMTLSPVSGGISIATTNGCTSSTAGTFYVGTTATTAATNITAAINSCNTSFPAVGVTAGSAAGVVTVTAATLGTGGNSITLADTLSNFTWAGANLTGGADGTADTTHFPYWSVNTYVSASQLATNIAAAINSNLTVTPVIEATPNLPASGQITFTKLFSANTYTVAPASFSAFTVSGGGTLTGGAQAAVVPNALPAKWGPSLTTASCANDFVVYPTGQTGSTSAATVVAYNNVYVTGCSGTVPSVYWAYNTGTGSYVTTSPVVNFDGTQVAFIQSNGGAASLVLLRWTQGTNNSTTSPVTPTVTTAADYAAGCTSAGLPCMFTIPFGNGNNDTISSPYIDFTGSVAYVGDDSGSLHKFTGVFSGTPTEVTTGGWPASLGGSMLSSPVYESNSGFIFVGDIAGTLFSVTTGGVIQGSATPAVGGQIADAPLVDGTVGAVYVFVNTATANTVYRFSTAFTSISSPGAPTSAALGTGGTGYYLYAGAFDNVYFQSANGTGNLWVVGNTGATTGGNLYRAAVSSGTLTGTVTSAVTVTGAAHPWPSPLTEFCNGTCTSNGTITTAGTDYVFFSVNRGNSTGCTNSAGNGCIVSYRVTTPTAPTLGGAQNYTVPGTAGCWATGGIVIDNADNTTTGASQIYFVGLNGADAGNPGGKLSSVCTTGTALTINAIQAAQSNP